MFHGHQLQQEGSALGEEGQRGTIMLKNTEAAEKPSWKKNAHLGLL